MSTSKRGPKNRPNASSRSKGNTRRPNSGKDSGHKKSSYSGIGVQLHFKKKLEYKNDFKQTKIVFYDDTFSTNKKRVKEIENQLLNHKNWGDQLRKLSFQIERVYTDGI